MSTGNIPNPPAIVPDLPLPDDYTRPRQFPRPIHSTVAATIRCIPRVIQSVPQTSDYQRTAAPLGLPVVVALSLVERLGRHVDIAAAFWAVHEAVQLGVLVADRRLNTHAVQAGNDLQNDSWHRGIEEEAPYPLVSEHNPDCAPADPRSGGLPVLDWVRGPDWRRFESFIVRSTDQLWDLGPDEPLDTECRRFRWRNCVFEFTPTQARVVSRLWEATRHGRQCTAQELLAGLQASRLKDIFKTRVNKKLRTHPAWLARLIRRTGRRYDLDVVLE